MCCSTRSLFDGGKVSGVNVGSYPRRIWLGNNPVVAFFLLLCTAEAGASLCVQSSGFADVTIWRYRPTHWFFLSERWSVCTWNAVEMFWLIPNFAVIAFPNREVNLGSLSEMILVDSPNQGYTFYRYSWAIPGPVIWWLWATVRGYDALNKDVWGRKREDSHVRGFWGRGTHTTSLHSAVATTGVLYMFFTSSVIVIQAFWFVR